MTEEGAEVIDERSSITLSTTSRTSMPPLIEAGTARKNTCSCGIIRASTPAEIEQQAEDEEGAEIWIASAKPRAVERTASAIVSVRSTAPPGGERAFMDRGDGDVVQAVVRISVMPSIVRKLPIGVLHAAGRVDRHGEAQPHGLRDERAGPVCRQAITSRAQSR